MKRLLDKTLLMFALSIMLTSCEEKVPNEPNLGGKDETEEPVPTPEPETEPEDKTKQVYEGDMGISNDDLQFTLEGVGALDNLIPKDAVKKDIVADYEVNNTDTEDDTAKLQAAIEQLSADGGGIIYFPKGTYYLHSIRMRNNIHLQIEAGSTIKPVYNPKEKRFVFFTFGGAETIDGVKKGIQVENCSVCGVNGRFTFDLTENTKNLHSHAFSFVNIKNFMVSDIDIKDALTPFPMLLFAPNSDSDPEIFGPTNGTVKNISAYNCSYGYGVVQAHCGKKIWFENLYGLGGVTLRFETGAAEMNERQFGGVFDCIGKNITCENGNAAVMIAPHSMHNGIVQVDGIKSISSGFAVRTEGGYISNKYENPNPGVELDGGSYAEGCFVKNVEATYGLKAQVKPKHKDIYPESLLYLVDRPTVDSYWSDAPSVAAVLAARILPVKYGKIVSYKFINKPLIED